ncbi:MAG: hypothetical protein ACSLFI_00035 [Solirubrobacterales bacterium]
MAMIQVEDAAAARDRAKQMGIREVFDVEFEDDPDQPGIVRIDLDLNGRSVSIDPSAI